MSGEGEDLASKAELPRAQDERRVLLILAVGDERPRVRQPADVERVVIGAREDDVVFALHHRACTRFVDLDDERRHVLALQTFHECFHGRRETIDDHVIAQTLVRDTRQAWFEALGQEGDEVDRNDEEDQEHPDELHHDHEDDHGRMLPARVRAVPGRRQRLPRPLQRLPECARLSFEPRHPELIEPRREDEKRDQSGNEQDQTRSGARHGENSLTKMKLLCTVRTCHAPLEPRGRTYVCANHHSFDLSRHGYVNLLQPQDKKSRSPGDTPAAVTARRRFLERGFAQPLVHAIVRAVPLREGDALLDAGCGEGHHTDAFRRAYGAQVCGVDISVPAIDLAARKYRECEWVVANADRFLPYADKSFRAVTSITARLNAPEFARVLAPGGTLLVAIPGAADLVELREAIQGEGVERDRVARTIDLFAPHFDFVRHELVQHVAHLDHEAIADVMTSTYRGLRTRERERLEATGAMDVTLARDLLVFCVR